MGSSYPNPLVKFIPIEHVNVFMYELTQSSSHIISKIKCCFHQYFIYIHKCYKMMA